MAVAGIPWPYLREIPKDDWRPPTGTRVISADDHVEEPEHLWQERLPAADRDRGPQNWRDEHNVRHLALGDRPFEAPGFQPRPLRTGHYDRQARLKDMDEAGIDASFLFPQETLMVLSMEDKDLMVRCLDVYNEWLSEWCAAAPPGRLYGVAILPTWLRPEATRDAIQRLKHLGFKALELPSEPRGVFYNSRGMEPLWDAIEESGIPLSFHVGPYIVAKGAGSFGINVTRNMGPFRQLWLTLAFSGVLERHPELKVVFTEGGASWAASALYDADRIYQVDEPEMNPKLAELPSYYWYRQCYTTFMDDPAAIRTLDMIGADNVMWSIDYPHAESVLGREKAMMRSFVADLGEEKARKILGGNAAGVWGI